MSQSETVGVTYMICIKLGQIPYCESPITPVNGNIIIMEAMLASCIVTCSRDQV